MRQLVVGISIVVNCAQATFAFGQPAAKNPIEYVGQVIIIGNTITQDRVIRRALELYPGQILVRADLKSAEKRLARLGLFKLDPIKKTGPTVKMLDSGGPFKDILVQVEEANARRMKWETSVNSKGRPVVRLVMEDRNFDLFRLPTSLVDVYEGNAFRGGGQKVRLEILRLSVLDARVEIFPQGLIIPVLIRPLLEE